MTDIASGRAQSVWVHGRRVIVPAGVLDPVRFRTGASWAPRVGAAVAEREAARVLDLGCGTGVVGLFAQQAGAAVVATDLDPRACAAAQRNGLPDVRQGDLFGPVVGEAFDLVCFNPPFFAGTGVLRRYRRALYGGPRLATVRAFSARVHQHLRPGGEAWVLLSDRAPHAHKALGPGWSALDTWTVCPPEGAREVLTVWCRRAAG